MAWKLIKQITQYDLRLDNGAVFENKIPLVDAYPEHFKEIGKTEYMVGIELMVALYQKLDAEGKWFLAKS